MIAKLVNSLHAQRAGNLSINHMHSEAIGDGDAEVSRLQDGVATIFLGGQSRDEATGVWLSAAPKALSLSIVWRGVDQPSVNFLIKLVRSFRLILGFARHSRRSDPSLSRSVTHANSPDRPNQHVPRRGAGPGLRAWE